MALHICPQCLKARMVIGCEAKCEGCFQQDADDATQASLYNVEWKLISARNSLKQLAERGDEDIVQAYNFSNLALTRLRASLNKK